MIVFNEFLSTVKHSTIKRLARFGRDPTLLFIIVLAGLGTAYVLVRTATYGAAVRPNSVILLSTVLNFLAGEGWRDFMGRPMVGYPPLFPLLLAAGGWVGIDPLETGRWVNAAAFGLTILAAGCWLRSNLRSRWLALTATALIATSLPLSLWASYIRTDPLFFLFALLALMQLSAFLNRKTDAALWWAAGLTALAAITRYPGVVLIGTGVLLLLPVTRWNHTLVFGAVSSVPLLAVLARNWAVTGNLTQATGYRTDPTGQSLTDGLHQTVKVFRTWIVSSKMPDGVAYLLGLGVAVVVLAGAVVILRRRQLAPEAAPADLRLGPVIPFGAFTVGYIAFMVAVVPFTVTQKIDSRFLLPIYAPLVLMAALLLDRFLSIEATGRMRAGRYVVGFLVGLAILTHIGFSTRKHLHRIATAQAGGFPSHGMNAALRQHSETLKYLRDNPIEDRIYSNYKYPTWFWDRTAVPDKHRHIPESWAEIETGAYIFWFGESHRHGYDVLFRVLPGAEIVAELADGVVLRRTAANPSKRYVDQLIQQADEQVVRAGWTVCRIGRKLIYLKSPCGPEDVQAKFVLHVVPTDPADLPAHRKQYSSDNLDFYFDQHGMRIADQCMVLVPLPAYAMDRIYIGQWIPAADRTLWEVEFSPSR